MIVGRNLIPTPFPTQRVPAMERGAPSAGAECREKVAPLRATQPPSIAMERGKG